MVTQIEKEVAGELRSIGRKAFDLADEIDPPYPCGPFEPGSTCVGAGGWPGFTDQEGIDHPSCQATCSEYLKWETRQEK